MTLKPFAIGLIVAGALSGGGALAVGGALAQDAGRAATRVSATYGVYWAGLHFGDIRVDISVRGSEYELKGDGESSGVGGMIYKWSGGTTGAGTLGKSGPQPSLYTLSYSGGNKKGELRMSFSGGAVADVSASPKKRPNPKAIPVTKEQLRGVLDPMTGALLRLRPNLPGGDLKICDEVRRGIDWELVDRGIDFMSSHADQIEVWLVPLPGTALYLPYRISVPTAFGSGSGEMLSFEVGPGKP